MDILDLRPDDLPMVAAAVELENAAVRVDAPWRRATTVAEMAGRLKYGWDMEPEHPVIGVADGDVLALGAMEVTEWDNTDLAWLHVTVRPDARGRGLGQQTLDHLVAMA